MTDDRLPLGPTGRPARRATLTGLTGLATGAALTALAAGNGTAYAAAPARSGQSAQLAQPARPARHHGHGRGPSVRFATFNTSLNRPTQGGLLKDLATRTDAQAKAVAEIVQRVRPDVILLQEFDYDSGHEALALFERHYLGVAQHPGVAPLHYGHRFLAPVNTGVPTGIDVDGRNGAVTTPGSGAYADDCYGYGLFPGQYGMAVLSRFPIDVRRVRTFQKFLWRDMPGNAIPDAYYTDAARQILRLSSKSHWDVPIRIGGERVHFLVDHPTPPVFDGPDDHNGHRNHDEIRFWADYVRGGRTASYIYDDLGDRGGLCRDELFVVAGDHNADPYDGDSYEHAIRQLLDSDRVNLPAVPPASAGGVEAAALQGGANAGQSGNPAYDTIDSRDNGPTAPGNLRLDVVLPSHGLEPGDNGVFWPTTDSDLYRLTGDGKTVVSSDHRLVWQDMRVAR
ncbi:endonuclease/exonuclease/phosphatase family protein [Streptomyces beihaiensis]|uniref:Endonuclease/exonuclease/phosphatase family protein n=1 Tax=Streptomyces beihaiensis TaxID=2984495 RepID=A0ABT3TXJ0_9ACTN|nr:endonuclease/exonuclease/phosphatase family protein [Streptomyces beihaiensis]MCX3061760.1 endonuclease/exonuclease/phosphatase family protein [Streptomyces beihaiensis]